MKKIIFTLIALLSLTALIGCTSKEVTVSFIENGGAAIADIAVVQETTMNEPLVTREGYTFEGWYSDLELSTPFDFDTVIIRNITLYAKWSINTYTVTFVMGDGTDDVVISDEYSSTIEFPTYSEKTGYVFGGWYLEAEGVNEFTSNRIPSADTTVYAYWIQSQYTVNFYFDSSDTPAYTETVLYGEAVENPPAIPVVTGMNGAWSEDITAVTSDLEVSVTYTKQTFDITFKDYEENTYNIVTLEYGDLITSTSTPERVGYDFIGYYSPELDLNIDLSTYTVTEDLVLVDNFQIQTFSVKFFGGETNALLGTVEYIDYGSNANAPTEGIDRVGYTFTGWDIAFDTVTSNLNIYAEYTINQYTASFDANGGVYSDTTSIINLNQDYNSNVTVPEEPTREGYDFTGWYLDLNYEEEVYFGTGIPMSLDGITVYAKWFDLSTTSYTVSGTYYFEQVGIAADELSTDDTYVQTSSDIYTPFVNVFYNTEMSPVRDIEGYEFYKYVMNGEDCFDQTKLLTILENETVDVYYRRIVQSVSFSEFNTENTTTYYVYYNTTLTNIPTATPVTGYDFLGYYAPSLEKNINLTTFSVTEDLVLEENFQIQTFSVSFFGGESNALLGDVQTIDYGTSANAPTEGYDRIGYTMTGWNIIFDSVTSNLEVYAEYTINPYTAVFDANGGVYSDTTSIINVNQDFNSNVTVPEVPTRQDYEFAGWYYDLNGEPVSFYAGIQMPADGFTVYAKWITLIGTSYTVSGTYYLEQVGIATDELSTDGVYAVTSSGSYDSFFNIIYNDDMSPISEPEGYEFFKYVFNGQEYFDETQLITITQDETVDVYYRRIVQTVTFSEFNTNDLTSYYVYYKESLTNVPTATPVIGYDFVGYYAPSLASNVDVANYEVTEDLVLEEDFQIQTFSVSFYGGELDTLLGDVQTIEYGSSALAPTEGIDRDVYTFAGWDITFNTVTTNLEVHAEYTLNQYTASFDANSGVYLDSTDIKNLTQDYNTTVAVPEVPTKDGFVFVGWFTDLNYDTEVYFSAGSSMPKDGFTVYAKWSELVATTYTVDGTYYYEQEGISTDQLSTDGVYVQTTPEVYTPFINVLYGTDMSPVREIEGYEFYKFVYDGTEYFDESQLITITQDETVDVYYRKIVLSISFSEQISGENETTKYYVYYNGSITVPPTPTPVTGMTVFWERQNFENIKTNLSVVAIQYDDSLKTVIFRSNGTIIYISANEDTAEPHTIVITATSPIWGIQQSGYRFDGWYISGTETLVANGVDLYYDDAYFDLANVTTIEARWVELSALNPATDVSMVVDTNNDTIIIDFSVAPIDTVYPTDFTFILNGDYIQSSDVDMDTLMNYITHSGDLFTLTLTDTDAYYDFFKENLMSADDNYSTLIPGTHTLQIISVGDDYATISSDASVLYQYKVESIYEGIPESSTVTDYYIIEDFGNGALRYIFYSNLTYQFSGMTFDIETGSNHITADGNKLSTTELPGEFRFTITDELGTRTYDGLVIKDIRQFDIGSSYQNYLTQVNATTEDDSFLESTIDAPYYVGASNDFYLDILIRDNNGAKISLDDALITYEFFMNDSVTPLDETNLGDYVTLDGNVMDFTDAAIGAEFRIVVEPKYEATLMDMDTIEFNILVTDGSNAFTNSELKALYADLNVNQINIHRDIEAELSSIQVYADGSPINFYARPTNDYSTSGNVYYRINGNTDDDQITLEGNFMTIDGSNIEYINPELSDTIGYALGFDIISTQIGIFYYNVSSTASETVNNNEFTMNNLKVVGNTTTPSVNYGGTEEEIINQERLMSQNSGGMLGVIVRNGKGTLNNLVIGYTVIGLTTNAYGENTNHDVLTVDLDYVTIYDSWANSIYLHGGSGVSIDNSNFGSSGGAAIHFEDVNPGVEVYDNPALNLGVNNEINNWISGQESWFKAYAMTSIALGLKSSINGSVASLEKTIIQMRENTVTGFSTEMMNLVFLSLPMTSAVTYSNPDDSTSYITASEVAFNITDPTGTTILERDWNFTVKEWPTSATTSMVDPRVSGGQYGFALGSLSDTYAFLQMITDIMTAYYGVYGVMMDEADAGNLAAIAGFYNLTAMEVLQVAGVMGGGLGIQDSIIAVKGSLDYAQPQYIEVVAPLSLTGAAGNATILIEMFNISEE